MISTDLLLKGLGGVAVVGGATTVGVFYFRQSKTEDLKTFAARVELVCNGTPTETTGVECSKSTKADSKIKVKKGTDTFEVSTLPATGGGKIKVYKTSKGEDHKNNFKFVIEEGDVSGENSKKLEEFETYEIKEEGKEWKLTRKTDIDAGIKKALGLPEDDKCNLPTTATEVECDISGDKFKKIKFDGGNEERGEVSTGTKLKISKVEGSDYGDKYKFKFVLESTADTKISKTTTIKANTNTEFKIKVASTTGSPKTLTLEKAWTLASLGAKVGLKECGTGSTTPKECSFDAGKLNLFNDANTHAKEASLSTGDASKKIKVEEDQPGYSQGFKLYVTDADLTLNNGNSGKKIHKKESSNNSPTYEIKEQSPTNGTKGWYLSKVTTAQGGGGA